MLQKRRLQKYREQLEACIIKAPAPGHVIYSSTTDRYSRERGRIIEVGAEVRERQHLISIPDLSAMKVGIRIHEMWIDKIELGQKARVTIAAFADLNFDGKVLKKSPMAVGGSFFDRDTKSYATDISIDGTHDCLKTGMTAKVEIIIKELKGVIAVPIQAVINRDGTKIYYVAAGSGPEARTVETGDFNTDFVEITSGLAEGEEVLLNPQMIIGSTQTEDVNGHSKH